MDYRRLETVVSPWTRIEGWHLRSCFHDPMHVLFLGTCKDLYASALGYWLRKGFYGGDGTLTDKLRRVSIELKKDCKDNGNLALGMVFCV